MTMNKKALPPILIMLAGLLVLSVMLLATGCRESTRVSYNISRRADQFDVKRRLTVFNTRTDKCLLQMIGNFALKNEGNNELSVIVELDREKGIYQKHFVYLNEWTTYTVEDLNGISVSRYQYELEFMPQMLAPVKITTDEIKQDIEDFVKYGETETEEGK